MNKSKLRTAGVDNQLLDGFILDDVLVEPITGRVTGPAATVHLAPRAIEVLLCLAKSPRKLVPREDILVAVWGDAKGSFDALSHSISDIRHALGDHAESPRFIQTVPRRGYRLLVEPRLKNAPVTAPNAEAESRADPEPIFWKALVRHGVVQASAAYLVCGWLIIQVADATFTNLGLPPWSTPFVTFVVVGGFPVVVALSWFLEVIGGQMVRDRGQQRGHWFQALERNYLAIIAAYGIATIGAGVYQAAVGFRVSPGATEDALATAREAELIPIAENSVAVLRLLNLDGSETTRIFGDGLSEDILDRLARLPGLRVSSRGDAWSLPPNASSDMVRKRLRVAYFLEGSVRLIGDELRVVAQLIDSDTGFHVVSRRFAKELDDYMSVQDEITQLIVGNLRPRFPDEIESLPAVAADEAEFDVYLLYRRGKGELDKPFTRETIDRARDYFHQALAIDPDYPPAHAGLCSAYIDLYELEHDTESVDAAEEACASAMAVNSQVTIVHNAIGRLNLLTGKIADAERSFDKALEINERDVPAIQGLARVYQKQQRFEEAEQRMREAIELQPGNWHAFNILGGFLFGMGRYAEAAEQFRRVVFLDPENHVALGNLGSAQMMAGSFVEARRSIERSLEVRTNETFYSNLGIIYYYLGEFEKSAGIQRKVVELSPNSVGAWLSLGDALYFAGDQEAAMEAFGQAAKLARQNLAISSNDGKMLYRLAWAETMLGNAEQAAELIERSVAAEPANPYSHYYDSLIKLSRGNVDAAVASIVRAEELGYPVVMLAAEPYLKDLRNTDAFNELLNKQARVN